MVVGSARYRTMLTLKSMDPTCRLEAFFTTEGTLVMRQQGQSIHLCPEAGKALVSYIKSYHGELA